MSGRRDRPNVVVCLCDQLRAFEVGCYGNGIVRTPHMDRLAAGGVRFDIACSNNPVCTPARSVLLSGQYGRTCTGMLDNVQEPVPARRRLVEPTLPEVLGQAGYHTALVGKWHIDPDPRVVGFDHVLRPFYSHRYTGQTYYDADGTSFEVPEFGHEVELQDVGRYVAEHRGEPFFLFHNISQPHMPVGDMPERYKSMYSREEVPLRPNVWRDGAMAHDERWFRVYLWDYLYYREHLPYTDAPLDGFDLRDLTALYYGATTWADDQLGELMRVLDANGVADDTIVVFTSDHGDNLGSHQCFNKDRLFEESIRIPMIMSWPRGLEPRAIDSQVASLVDVMPTLLSLAGVDVPRTVQGTDLAPVASGEAETAGENLAFVETPMWEMGVRTPTHLLGAKLVQGSGERPVPIDEPEHVFFDLSDDPYEEHNLTESGEQSSVAARLRERLLRWNVETPWLSPSDGP